MQKPISAHTPFFTSLKHLEKRLKLENNQAAGGGPSTLAPPPPPAVEVIDSIQQTDSLGSPIYLCDQSQSAATATTDVSFVQESEPPRQFLSSPDPPPINHEEEALERAGQPERLDLDSDIELLMQLLRLSAVEEIAESNGEGCDVEFYERIVGVKGPKTSKEFKRLDRWIEHFFKGEKNETFRLAHLLLGKAAFLHRDDDGFEGLVYPSTIDEFLKHEPPLPLD